MKLEDVQFQLKNGYHLEKKEIKDALKELAVMRAYLKIRLIEFE